MCLYFALMYKTLGGYNWSDLFYNAPNNATFAPPLKSPLNAAPMDEFDFDEHETIEKTILDSAKELQISFHGLKAVCFYIKFLFTMFRKIFFLNTHFILVL